MPQNQYISHYERLKDKWTDQNKALQKQLAQKHSEAFNWVNQQFKHSALSTIGAMIIMATPMATPASANQNTVKESNASDSSNIDKKVFLVTDLANILPSDISPLDKQTDDKVREIVNRDLKLSLSTTIDNISLNQTYGFIGQEQHLARYPGDNMDSHLSNNQDAINYGSEGMAPGLGAWGYFSDSSNLSQVDIDREKYYIAVQTFLAPGYDENATRYNNFFKYRKMLLVNPQNGKAIVCDIADSGPAAWTGKQLGGSPEVMSYLQRFDGAEKGPVLYYFINDPEDKIPLGPYENY